MGRTSIEWVRDNSGGEGYTWNALRARRKVGGRPGVTANHCEHVNEACRFCYAERLNARLGGLPFKPGHRKDYDFFVDEKMLYAPLRMRRPTRIFVESMSDAFGDWWSLEFIDRLYAVMAVTPQHTYINLSKRPERRRDYLDNPLTFMRIANEMVRMRAELGEKIVPLQSGRWPFSHVIEGTSVSCQDEANEFVPILLQTNAAVKALSCEPLLGPISLSHMLSGLDWVIVGGESGQSSRPMHPAWALIIRDQCEAADVAFHFKQWGSWKPVPAVSAVLGEHGRSRAIDVDGNVPGNPDEPDSALAALRERPGAFQFMAYVGKKKSGRKLDGREYNGFPALAS
jgi:protein gp37